MQVILHQLYMAAAGRFVAETINSQAVAKYNMAGAK